jgi:hypothetical protein
MRGDQRGARKRKKMENQVLLTRFCELMKGFDKEKLIFGFCGPISQELMVEMASIWKQTIVTGNGSRRQAVSRVFSILVEQVQNIIHYSAERHAVDGGTSAAVPLSWGIIAVGREGKYHTVTCGNMVDNNRISGVRERLDKLQNMDKDQLKVHYKERMRTIRKDVVELRHMRDEEESSINKEHRSPNPKEWSNGIGLGLIEVARRGSRPLEFDIRKVDREYSFLTLKSYI